jgi:hypothetical protein
MRDEWKLHRSVMAKPFQFTQVKDMAACMVAVAMNFVQYLKTLPAEARRLSPFA